STDESGNFIFETYETGTQMLVVSMMGFETHYQPGDISYFEAVKIKLSEAINTLSGVTLTAGTFEAGDNSKASVLKPLDIVTTAGAAGDFVAALQTLPGTSKVSENGRLFVRGGEAGETRVFIDGLRVFQPFNATASNIPTRGRFSPFLFKGITFSTGGYSAEYGQALSSVLLLNTTDVPDQEKTDLSIMSVGGGVGHTEIWEDESLSINTSYINLEPYEALIPSDQGVRWRKPFESASGEAVFRSRKENGFLKLYTGFAHSNLDIDQEDINYQDFIRFRLKNNNLYLNGSYKHFFNKEWTLGTGASVSYDTNAIGLIDDTIDTKETGTHVKLKLQKGFSNRFNLCLGTEYLLTRYRETFSSPDGFSYDAGFTDHLGAAFVEGDIFLSNRFAMKLGVRAEHSDVLADFNVVPRASVAYKSSENGQFSLAYGTFYQNPLTEYVKYDQNLEAEKTSHYILNYQYLGNGRTFRAEAYYKDYDNLLKYDTDLTQFNSNFSNSGHGYATGLDVFWRDNSTVDYLDYWISYSYLNTERDYRNFRETATPNFAPRHSASAVAKYFVTDWRSQIGLSYSYGSGRSYDDPNVPEFMSGKTISYNNLSINWAYVIDPQKILYFSVNNVLGFKNINNYQYASTPDANGNFDRLALRPAADSFFFVGFFWTISEDKKSNQLENL
ncbi:MAG TPA: TonB-dependent receptor, partial [Eudoraea sp.]|nr:TonB-dependent receptor [Eudoraea sp.]